MAWNDDDLNELLRRIERQIAKELKAGQRAAEVNAPRERLAWRSGRVEGLICARNMAQRLRRSPRSVPPAIKGDGGAA
jgi:hypothetical protein